MPNELVSQVLIPKCGVPFPMDTKAESEWLHGLRFLAASQEEVFYCDTEGRTLTALAYDSLKDKTCALYRVHPSGLAERLKCVPERIADCLEREERQARGRG